MNQQITQALVCYLVFINILTCVIYGIDKQKARSRQWRVPEKTLLLLLQLIAVILYFKRVI